MKTPLIVLAAAMVAPAASVLMSQQQHATDSHVLENKVSLLLEKAYRLPAVAAYCSANPMSVYIVEIEGVTLTVRCVSWVEWRNRITGKEP